MHRKLISIALCLFTLLAASQLIFQKDTDLQQLSSSPTANPAPKFKPSSVKPFWQNGSMDPATGTGAIKQSGWYKNAIQLIQNSEYEIRKDEDPGEFIAPNRQQQLKCAFSYNSLTISPRHPGSQWCLRMRLDGIYAGKKLISQPSAKDIAFLLQNRLTYKGSLFTTEYINNEAGVRQNFIINRQPQPGARTITIKLGTNSGWFINKVHDQELHFARLESGKLSRKITYNSLKVWDATQKAGCKIYRQQPA
jgi:hypothetical protein